MSKDIDIEKLKKSTNHIGLAVFIIAILLIISQMGSLILTLVLSSGTLDILPEEIVTMLSQNISSIYIFIIYAIVEVLVLLSVLVISNKVKNDDLMNPDKTSRNVLLLTLFFILRVLINMIYDLTPMYIHYSDGTTEASRTFSIPIFEIIILIVLIKNLVNLNKYIKNGY